MFKQIGSQKITQRYVNSKRKIGNTLKVIRWQWGWINYLRRVPCNNAINLISYFQLTVYKINQKNNKINITH